MSLALHGRGVCAQTEKVMTQAPTPPFTAYPRKQMASGYGSIDKFKALGEGYFGLNWVFAANLVLVVAVNMLLRERPGMWMPFTVLEFVAVALLTFPMNEKIAEGMGWGKGSALLASVLMGLNSSFFAGIVGYFVMQAIARGEMRKYGLEAGLTVRKMKFEKLLSEMYQTGKTRMDFPSAPRW